MTEYFEIKRKSVHFLIGILISLLIYFDFFYLPFWFVIFYLMAAISVILSGKYRKSWLSRFIASIERKEELEKIPILGALTFLFGSILSFVFFGKDVAICAIITLFFGDSVLAIYGTYFGKIKSPFLNREKHFDATAVGIILNTIIIFLLFPFSFWKILLASIISMFYELFVPFKNFKNIYLRFLLDDNIIIPLLFGLVLSLLIRPVI